METKIDETQVLVRSKTLTVTLEPKEVAILMAVVGSISGTAALRGFTNSLYGISTDFLVNNAPEFLDSSGISIFDRNLEGNLSASN